MSVTKKQNQAKPPTATSVEQARSDFFPGAWLIGSYGLLVVIFFLPALMPGMQIFGTDYLAAAYFFEEFVTQRFAAGELPKWLPYVYGGVPFFANPMDTYYPVTLLLRVMGVETHRHLAWIFVVNFFAAGTGTYLLLRELGTRRMPAYLAGLLYMFAGYLISYIYGGHEGRAIVATLSPLFLFAIHRGVRTGGFRWFVLGGATLGSALLSFQIQSAYYMLLAGGLWGIFLLWHFQVLRDARALGGRLAGAASMLVIGFAMAAINFIPFLSYVDVSPRGGEEGRGYEYATSWAMPPEEIVGLAVPERIGVLQQYWGDNPFKLHTEYAGALTILLVVAGAYLLRRQRYAWFFFGLGVFTLTIAFGGHTPIYRLYYEFLPGTQRFRAPSISFYLLTLSMAVLAGLALEWLSRLRDEREARSAEVRRGAEATLRTTTGIAVGLLAVVLLWALAVAINTPDAILTRPTTPEALREARAALNHDAYRLGVWRFMLFLSLVATGVWLWVRGAITTRVAGVLLALVSVADLWVIDKKFLDAVPEPAVYFAPDQVANFLRSQPGPFRTFVLFDLPQDDYLNLFGIELVGGEHGNQLQTYNEFLGAGAQTYTDFHNMNDPRFLALANAKYLVSTQQIAAPFLEPVYQGRVRDGRTATVYENLAVLPRAFVVPTAVRIDGTEATLERMRSPEFDPTREVILADDPPVAAADTENFEGSAQVIHHEPSEVAVRVSASDSAYLVLTDNFYEGWVAAIDGEEVPIHRAYHTFRAVVVPPGEHTVTFRFEPRSLQIGALISAGTGVFLLLFGAGLLYRSRSRRGAAEA